MKRFILIVPMAVVLAGCVDNSAVAHHGTPPQDPPDYHGVPTDDRPPQMLEVSPPQ